MFGRLVSDNGVLTSFISEEFQEVRGVLRSVPVNLRDWNEKRLFFDTEYRKMAEDDKDFRHCFKQANRREALTVEKAALTGQEQNAEGIAEDAVQTLIK